MMNVGSYTENLILKIIENSKSNTWEGAVHEWSISDWDEDPEVQETCICGKENIRYLYSIENKYTKKILEPIGSQCIKKFDRDELTEFTIIYEDLFKLRAARKNRKYIELNSNFFTKKLLYFFYEEGVYDSAYNNFNGKNDYEFMLKMFNKRKKENITDPQQRKIRAIIIKQIIPFVDSQLNK